ncbi:MgtC/SapB family protein [Aliiglaciecola litoralis]
MDTLLEIDFVVIVQHLLKMGIAFLLALPLAINREQQAQSAGLRTFPLVTIASCAFMLVGIDVFRDPESQARVMYGIVTGIGFIGGGSIIKSSENVYGTATAASIWLTGAIGVSVAFNRYEIAIVLSVVGYLVLKFLGKYKST